jgi:hypothetical protein
VVVAVAAVISLAVTHEPQVVVLVVAVAVLKH